MHWIAGGTALIATFSEDASAELVATAVVKAATYITIAGSGALVATAGYAMMEPWYARASWTQVLGTRDSTFTWRTRR